jgi:sterol desaturase/sphingolipid hydroxylase (fatty acid hydroxylase superfamily)
MSKNLTPRKWYSPAILLLIAATSVLLPLAFVLIAGTPIACMSGVRLFGDYCPAAAPALFIGLLIFLFVFCWKDWSKGGSKN